MGRQLKSNSLRPIEVSLLVINARARRRSHTYILYIPLYEDFICQFIFLYVSNVFGVRSMRERARTRASMRARERARTRASMRALYSNEHVFDSSGFITTYQNTFSASAVIVLYAFQCCHFYITPASARACELTQCFV